MRICERSEARRKLTAFILICILSVAEGRRVRANIQLSGALTTSATKAQDQSENVARQADAVAGFKAGTTAFEEQLRAQPHIKHVHSLMESSFAQLEGSGQHSNADANFEWHLASLTHDSTLDEQLKEVTRLVEVMMIYPLCEKRLETLEDRQNAHRHLASLQLSQAGRNLGAYVKSAMKKACETSAYAISKQPLGAVASQLNKTTHQDSSLAEVGRENGEALKALRSAFVQGREGGSNEWRPMLPAPARVRPPSKVSAMHGHHVSKPIFQAHAMQGLRVAGGNLGPSPSFSWPGGARSGSQRAPLSSMMAHEDAAANAKPALNDERLPSAQGPKLRKVPPLPHWIENAAHVVEKGSLPSKLLILATILSMTLANLPATSSAWLRFWASHVGPAIGGHALSVQGWINEGLMAIFFFVVGLEIKQELRFGSLSTAKEALLPAVAALGGMVTPMAIYLLTQALMPIRSMAALTVPMATDIAFAMGVLGFFRKKMPASASAFLLTLATVDDFGAILVLATCFAKGVSMPFLGLAAGIFGALALVGRKGYSDLRLFGAGGAAMWYALLRAGVNSDVAGVLAAMSVSTKALVQTPDGNPERLTERAIRRLSPLTGLIIMPLFALANTAIKLGGGATVAAAGTGAAAASALSKAMAAGIAAGLLIGKPLGVFMFTWLTDRLGLAKLPDDMTKKHLQVVSMLSAIGFTMCLLLTETALPAAMQTIPKLSIIGSSGLAAVVAAITLARMRPEASSNNATVTAAS